VSLDGPARAFSQFGVPRAAIPWYAFAAAVRDAAAFSKAHGRMPDEIWIGAENISPADYVATLGGAVEASITSGRAPAQVDRKRGRFTSDSFVAEDSVNLWSWPIFPDGFHAPQLMALARLQAWTLKPALLQH
jgi:hypothetical protein